MEDELNFNFLDEGIDELIDSFWKEYEVDVRRDPQFFEVQGGQESIEIPSADIASLVGKLSSQYDEGVDNNRSAGVVSEAKAPHPLTTVQTNETNVSLIKKKGSVVVMVECGICNLLLSKERFMDHWQTKHVELKNKIVVEPSPRCVGCLKGFGSCKALTCHVSGTGSDKCPGAPDPSVMGELASQLGRCQVCGKHYNSTEKAATCLAKNHSILRCPICLSTFKEEKRNNFKDHVKEFHAEKNGNGKNIYSCKFCKVVIAAFKVLVEHLAKHHYNPCLRRQSAVINTNIATTAAVPQLQYNRSSPDIAKKANVTSPTDLPSGDSRSKSLTYAKRRKLDRSLVEHWMQMTDQNCLTKIHDYYPSP